MRYFSVNYFALLIISLLSLPNIFPFSFGQISLSSACKFSNRLACAVRSEIKMIDSTVFFFSFLLFLRVFQTGCVSSSVSGSVLGRVCFSNRVCFEGYNHAGVTKCSVSSLLSKWIVHAEPTD